MMKLIDTGLEKSGIVVPPVDPSSDNWIKNLDDMLIIKAFVARNPDGNSEHLSKHSYKILLFFMHGIIIVATEIDMLE